VSIPGITIVGSGPYGVFPSSRTVTLSAYTIARYETTYELWWEVKTWAQERGYTFRDGRDGREGNGLVRQPGWLLNKSCTMLRVVPSSAEVVRKLKFPNKSIEDAVSREARSLSVGGGAE